MHLPGETWLLISCLRHNSTDRERENERKRERDRDGVLGMYLCRQIVLCISMVRYSGRDLGSGSN